MSKQTGSQPLKTGQTIFNDEQLQDIKAIIGLGNPGPKFLQTRHNVGFSFLDALADQEHGSFTHSDNAQVWEHLFALPEGKSRKILFLKPQTYMNSSGDVVSWLQKKGISAEQTLVVHDELEKKTGSLGLRQGGSARGHNGLRSLILAMGEDFWRLRVGIDRPEDKNQVSDYVLQRFKPAEQEKLQSGLEQFLSFMQPQV